MIGSRLRAVIKSTKPNNWLAKKTRTHSILLHSVWGVGRFDGSKFFFKSNNVLLLKRRSTPQGAEVVGPSIHESG